jgi:hypothetical protein
MSDSPAGGRAGNVIVPKIVTSYNPVSNNSVVQFNSYVNQNLQVNDHIWVDVPLVVTPVSDGEYVVSSPITGTDILPVDEDHFQTSYLPVSSNLGTYPKPVGGNNGVTFYPLVAPPMGRSGVVSINQSTYVLGPTESTLAQSPLNAPTVFNYFLPDYRFPGALSSSNLDSPEFQLSTDTNLSNVTNSLTNMIIGTGGGNGNTISLSSFDNGGGSIVIDISPYLTVQKTSNMGASALIDELATRLIGAPLEPLTKASIWNLVANASLFPLNSPPTNQQMRDRVRAIIHLIITSAESAVQK